MAAGAFDYSGEEESRDETDRRIGLTTTAPVEILYAAGLTPVDLNNIFVADAEARELVADAERRGFPQNACAWVKGLYAAARKAKIRTIAGVTEGDCSQNAALLDIWRSEGVRVVPFSFPSRCTEEDYRREMIAFCGLLGTTLPVAEQYKHSFDRIRRIAADIDRLAVERETVPSGDLFLSQLRLTDMNGDPDAEESWQQELLEGVAALPSADGSRIRLGVAGVPTILSDLWEVIEQNGARVVYHEVPHQFALLSGIGGPLVQAFLNYTYPRPAAVRTAEIVRQIRARRIRGLIHYVQSFCHRQIHDLILRQESPVPVLTIEADRPGPVDGRTRTRIEAFLEQLQR